MEKYDNVKKQCLSAVVRAIELEMERYEGWISLRNQEGDTHDIDELKASFEKLDSELELYRTKNLVDYNLPEKINMTAWIEDDAKEGMILHFDELTRSGPWYHVSGIVNDDYGQLEPEVRYNLVFYKVYPRHYYNNACFYICVTEIKSI